MNHSALENPTKSVRPNQNLKTRSLKGNGLYIETYGCQMNEYDSGLVGAILGERGYIKCEKPEDADIILLNTCAIREKAHEKIYNRLQNLASIKRRSPRTVIGILGCMAQNLGDDLFAHGLPVDFIMGPDNYRELPGIIERIQDGSETHINITQLSRSETYEEIEPCVVAGKLAFVTIMRGCDNFCSFCVVPYTRGRERSRKPGSIISEINRLVNEEGVREVTLLGQNVNSYNHAGLRFTSLVEKILIDTKIARIRFTSPHPHDFPHELLELMAAEDRFCSQIHLPIQSGSSSVLQRMHRDYTREEFLKLADEIRKMMPDVGLTSDVIVGFCGETDAEFMETLSLMQTVRFDMAFMFHYSEREMTAAHKKMADNVPMKVKLERLSHLIELQNKIGKKRNTTFVGSIQYIMVEGRSKRNAAELMGRTSSGKVVVFDSPDFSAKSTLSNFNGRFASVSIKDSTSATLRGSLIDWT